MKKKRDIVKIHEVTFFYDPLVKIKERMTLVYPNRRRSNTDRISEISHRVCKSTIKVDRL